MQAIRILVSAIGAALVVVYVVANPGSLMLVCGFLLILAGYKIRP